MLAAAALVLAPAAPDDASVYRKDVKFALDELAERCGHSFDRKGIRWKKVRAEFSKAARELETDQDEFMLLNRLLARLRDGHARVVVPETTSGVSLPDRGAWRGPSLFRCVSDGRILVKNAWGAAASAGIEPGMGVVDVDGEPVRRRLDAKIAEGVDTLIRRAEELLADFPTKAVPYRPDRFGWTPPR